MEKMEGEVTYLWSSSGIMTGVRDRIKMRRSRAGMQVRIYQGTWENGQFPNTEFTGGRE